MSRPPRIKRFDYRGLQRYFLTICTRERAPYLAQHETVRVTLWRILQTGAANDMEVTAYCFMPDHVHLLATGTARDADLQCFMKIAKQRTGWDFRQETGEHLWQEGFYDHVLRAEDATPSVVRYIINNPVRAGLVLRPQDYEFWGSQAYNREELLEFIQGSDEWIPDWKKRRV